MSQSDKGGTMAEPVGASRADEVFSMNMKQGQSLMDDIYNLMDKKQYQEAGKLARRLVQVAEKKGWQQLLNNALEMRLVVAIENNQLMEADELVRKLSSQPVTAYSLFLQARLLMQQHNNRDALIKGREAIAFAIQHGDTTPQLVLEKIGNLLGKLLSNYGEHAEALNYYWQAVQAADSLQLKALEYSNYLFNLHFVHNTPLDYFKAHSGYNGLFKGIQQYDHKSKYQLEAIKRKPVGKMRIGYISPDLRYHVVLRFSWAMLANYDKEHFEVYCYHNNPVEDNFSEEIKNMTDGWRNISSMNAKDAAEIIYRDKVDILVDLAGHTKGNGLPIMVYKPAPVQISGIGYFATTGLQTMDYFLSDKALQSESQYFCEDIIELPHSHFCYTPLYEAPSTGDAPCKKNGYITFGSFNAIRKINDEVLELWTNIIKAVPNSHLLLKGSVFDDEYGCELFCDRLAKFGININLPEWQNRIELRGFSRDYLQEYLDIDIALDTFPYPGGGTTCDALYMGVPVITLSGNSHGERFGKSLLENIGLSEFVVYDKQAYFDLAVALAGDKEIINNLHMGLRRMMEKSPLMDRNLYMGELEAAYKNIWQKYVGELKSMECPTSKEALNYSFDCYKERDYERAEGWCRIAIKQDKDNEYLVEGTSLLSDILQEKLDYVAAWQESKSVLEMLEREKDKGTKDFQRRLWMNYASRSLKLGYIDEAVNAYKQGAAFAVDGYDKFSLLGSALLARLCRTEDCEDVRQRLGEIDNCLPPGGKVSTQLTDEGLTEILPAPSGALSPEGRAKHKPSSLDVLPKYKAFPSGGGGHVVFGGGQVKKPHPPQAVLPPLEGRAHIAYISPDFRQHVMFSFYYTMLHSYNQEKFKVTCVSLTEKKDGFTEHLKGLVDNWIDVSDMKWPEIIERLKEENIDILVDLAGHSADSGIPAFYDRVARVQISGLGWMESTGLGCTDYLITDRYIDSDVSNITEKPLYLTSQFCYTGRNDVPISKGAPCREKGYITFGVFNHYHKITDEMLLVWKEIMDRVPDSRLLLKCQVLVSDSACAMVQERLQNLGFDLARVELEAATNTYMERYLDVDIAFDTYPYPGGGTTCDALYMGVPVVSLYGKRRGSRFGLSILSNTGLGELAVSNINEYIERAVGLANDEELLDVLHKNLRRMMNSSPIMDGKKYMEELEKAYIDILAGKKRFWWKYI